MSASNSGKKIIHDLTTGDAASAAAGESVASQLPGRENGPADAYRHYVLSAELARKYHMTYAELALYLHEFSLTPWNPSIESSMDHHNNEIGLKIGKAVRENGGTWEDVLKLTREYVQKSLAGTKPSDVTENWVKHSDGYYTPKVDKVTLSNGLELDPPALLNPNLWKKKPSTKGGKLSNEDSNMPDNDGFWVSKFVYERLAQAKGFIQPIVN